ncbi:7-deoxyloganetin glucosyltransferase [Camellia lanceoleosa]|uniref:7-deoxyloganetin glucosyltransferase n=1 Tax=Camellia lanceoleosa TaxID=1840588 RepID=A0ACC0HSY2_9ERIC|nr:7-deoxyloganetin glucosyltransferase [Camellia lanceoleosa]
MVSTSPSSTPNSTTTASSNPRATTPSLAPPPSTLKPSLTASLPPWLTPLRTSRYSVTPFCNFLDPFGVLLAKLNPPMTCVVSDVTVGFTVKAAQELGIPDFFSQHFEC